MHIDNRLDNPIDPKNPIRPIDIEKYSAMWKKWKMGRLPNKNGLNTANPYWAKVLTRTRMS